jgi:hypothetical protein
VHALQDVPLSIYPSLQVAQDAVVEAVHEEQPEEPQQKALPSNVPFWQVTEVPTAVAEQVAALISVH